MNPSLVSYHLSHETLTGLCNNEIAAIWLKEFYPPFLCEKAIRSILNTNGISSYPESPYFKRIGQPYSLAYEDNLNRDPIEMESYFKNNLEQILNIRALFSPYYSPIDDLRLRFDELWPHGARLKTVRQQKYLAGIIRILSTAEAGIPPHWDRYLPLYPEEERPYTHHLTANIYLKLPAENGELQLWLNSSDSIPPGSENKLAIFSEIDLGPPKLVINPLQGDLVIFNPRQFHAVGKVPEGLRISMGLFVGIHNENEPIEYWS